MTNMLTQKPFTFDNISICENNYSRNYLILVPSSLAEMIVNGHSVAIMGSASKVFFYLIVMAFVSALKKSCDSTCGKLQFPYKYGYSMVTTYSYHQQWTRNLRKKKYLKEFGYFSFFLSHTEQKMIRILFYNFDILTLGTFN